MIIFNYWYMNTISLMSYQISTCFHNDKPFTTFFLNNDFLYFLYEQIIMGGLNDIKLFSFLSSLHSIIRILGNWKKLIIKCLWSTWTELTNSYLFYLECKFDSIECADQQKYISFSCNTFQIFKNRKIEILIWHF